MRGCILIPSSWKFGQWLRLPIAVASDVREILHHFEKESVMREEEIRVDVLELVLPSRYYGDASWRRET